MKYSDHYKNDLNEFREEKMSNEFLVMPKLIKIKIILQILLETIILI